MQVIVIKSHSSNYPTPIQFAAGETVQVGRRDTEFPGWIWTTTADGNRGWAPEQLLEIDEPAATAVARENYTARELNTVPGQRLTVHRELNAWYWVNNEKGEYGWVPAKTVRPENEP